LWLAVSGQAGAYLRSEAVQSLAALATLAAGYSALGLDYPLAMALFAAVARLIPLIGVVLAVIPPLLTGWSEGWPVALAAAGLAAAVVVGLKLLIEPRLRDRGSDSPILTLLVMLALVDEFGLLGLVAAPPLAAAVQIVLGFAFGRQKARPALEPAEQMTRLRDRLDQLHRSAQVAEEPLPPEAANMLERLEELLRRASGAVRAEDVAPVTDSG
jgi:predicted PurR-regulated permease PerM